MWSILDRSLWEEANDPCLFLTFSHESLHVFFFSLVIVSFSMSLFFGFIPVFFPYVFLHLGFHISVFLSYFPFSFCIFFSLFFWRFFSPFSSVFFPCFFSLAVHPSTNNLFFNAMLLLCFMMTVIRIFLQFPFAQFHCLSTGFPINVYFQRKNVELPLCWCQCQVSCGLEGGWETSTFRLML